MTTTTTIFEAINNEFYRLGVSTDHDAYSGLTVDEGYGVVEGCVRVFDDYADGTYNASELLETLKALAPEDVSLESESPNSIWQLI